MLKRENEFRIECNFMLKQEKISEQMRQTLIDWIIKIHYNLRLLPETLFLTVNLIDRYLQINQITKQ
jgi:hypothetical protein